VSNLNAHTNNLYHITQQLGDQMRRNRIIAAGGAASALAATQIRYNDQPGKMTVGLGTGYYDSGAAFAAGIGGTSENGHWRVNMAVTYAPQAGKVGAGGGVSYSW
jgi:trimeric autotransporter adhesin